MSSASGERQGLGRFRALQLHSASTQCQHRKKKLRCKAGVDAMHFGLCKVCTALRPLAARNRKRKMKTWKKLFSFVKTWHWLSRAKKFFFIPACQTVRVVISLEKLESADDRKRKFLSRVSFATFCDTTLAATGCRLELFFVCFEFQLEIIIASTIHRLFLENLREVLKN